MPLWDLQHPSPFVVAVVIIIAWSLLSLLLLASLLLFGIIFTVITVVITVVAVVAVFAVVAVVTVVTIAAIVAITLFAPVTIALAAIVVVVVVALAVVVTTVLAVAATLVPFLLLCPLSLTSLGLDFVIALIALALIALAFIVTLVVIVFTVLAFAFYHCLLSAVIASLPAACLSSTDAGATSASCPPVELLLPLVALYFIMANYYIVALAPMPSSHCCSRRHRCHCIMIVSRPATLMEKSLQKKEMGRKSLFLITAQKLKTAFQTGTFSESPNLELSLTKKKLYQEPPVQDWVLA